eukprot:TRINITY_DN1057_c0_g1_i6.p1 TRINITY_DN1057_c0_g1~~TRINITY_DN1057_c0_g1_i6.p1  ORF type:complete len:509 (-),score=101.51 TRINITY_DN1057_c0_g1_i6:530-2056(-)
MFDEDNSGGLDFDEFVRLHQLFIDSPTFKNDILTLSSNSKRNRKGRRTRELSKKRKLETLVVHIMQARNLVSADLGATSDPYVTAHIGGRSKSKVTTKVKKKTLNPVWDEIFQINVLPNDETIVFYVKDKDFGLKSDPLGNLEIDLDTIKKSRPKHGWYKLNDIGHGELYISLSWKKKLAHHISMRGNFSLFIDRADNILGKDDGGTSSDPYCKIILRSPTLVNNRKNEMTKKTSVIKKSLNPVWEENFEWNDIILDPNCRVTVYLFDKDKIKSDDRLGVVHLSMDRILSRETDEHTYFLSPVKKSERAKGSIRICTTFLTNDRPLPNVGSNINTVLQGSDSVEIWKIEGENKVTWPNEMHGKFYDSDVYIILYTEYLPNPTCTIFIWIGRESLVEEYDTALKIANEIESDIGGYPTIYREMQNNERAKFIDLFHKSIEYLMGDIDANQKKNHQSCRLLHIKGINNIRVTQIECSVSGLNKGDSFILDGGDIIFQWNGGESNTIERRR